ncbi:MAG: hypothetical protein WCE62_08820 [Polyangiales bacterium]
MASESKERKVVIAILLTSTLLTMLSIAGILTGAYDLSLAPRGIYEPDGEFSDAQLQLEEARATNPYRRPMAAANVVVSALVLIGSFLLSWRRRLAQWWIQHAVAAKLVWIAAYTASLVGHIKMSFVPLPLEQPDEALSKIVGSVILTGSFSALLHLAAAHRATRPDIRQFIETAGKT